MKSRANKHIVVIYIHVYKWFKAKGHKSKLHIRRNRYNNCTKKFLEKKGTRRHHVIAHNHCINIEEVVLKNVK